MKTIIAKDLSPMETNAWLCGGITPRPIAFVSTINSEGSRNLAPFSFFNAFGSNPPTIAFAPNRRGRDGSLKDTYQNIKATEQFVVATVSYAMTEQMNISSADYPSAIDEFVKSGLTPQKAKFIMPALVKESPFQMECRLNQIVELGSGPGSGLMIIGEVLCFHIAEDCLLNNLPDPERLDQVGRNGGSFYTRAYGEALFKVTKPVGKPIGYDALPASLKKATFLTANDLGRLANSDHMPSFEGLRSPEDARLGKEDLEQHIAEALQYHRLDDAWYWIYVYTSK
jgi:flavin reductase (DIM6/NTAB) family NADH-FMN oxidoreductase RutF